MKKFFSILGVTATYWALVFLGPALIALVNFLDNFFYGAGLDPDGFLFSVLKFLAQPISCFAAYFVTAEIGDGKYKVCSLVNCIIGACLCFVFALTSSTTESLAVMILSAISCTITAVICAMSINSTKKSFSSEEK